MKQIVMDTGRRFRFISLGCALITTVALTAAQAATELDLVTNTEIVHNGAIFQQTPEDQPTGTGVFDPIVRINEDTGGQSAGPKDGQSAGYNTSGRPVAFDELTDPNWTRDLQLGELQSVEVDEAFYYCFRLDINEPGQDQALLSLDTIKIYVSATGSQTTSTVDSLGSKVYDLDAGGDVYLKLDARLRDGGAPGSGTGDMTMFVPVSLFDGYSASSYLYLFTEFGLQAGMKQDDIGEQAGFEEWAACIPEPGTSLLVGLGLVSLTAVMRRRR